MKKAITIMLLVTLLFTSSLLSYGSNAKNNEPMENLKTLSLEKAIEEGIKNSTQIKIADLNIKVKEVELSEARSQERKYKNSNVSLGTVQGFQLDANMLSKSAQFALEEEELKKDYLVEDIKYNVTLAYYGALQATDYVNIAKSSLENIKRNSDIVNKKFDLGVASKSEVLMAEIALNEANINMDKAKEDMQKANRALNMVLNYPLNTELNLTTTFKQESFNVDLEKDIEEAYKNRFDIIQLNNNYELVKLDFDTNAKRYTPNTYQYRYKESNLARVENLLKDSKQNVEFDIRNKYDAINSSSKQIELSKTNVEKAKEGLRLVEKSYEVGMATIQDVKDSIVQLYNTELALSRAISNYNLSILEYNKAVQLGIVR